MLNKAPLEAGLCCLPRAQMDSPRAPQTVAVFLDRRHSRLACVATLEVREFIPAGPAPPTKPRRFL